MRTSVSPWPKVWYSIPATYSAKFEEVMRR